VILDEHGQQADAGEVFLAPPSMGLSLELLNSDHHEVYYADTPRGPNGQLLRRHGDQMQHLPNGYFRAHGRVDDSMNLGGVKVSSQEIEEIVKNVPGVRETAAIAVPPPEGGPAKLIVYVVPADNVEIDLKVLKSQMQQEIRNNLNPLFKINDVVIIEALPRTASNKVMRRALRAEYDKKALSTE
jgi:acetyl-CoA synthetase